MLISIHYSEIKCYLINDQISSFCIIVHSFIIASTVLEEQQRVDTLHFELLYRDIEMLYLLGYDGPLLTC
jgi:hypothetical protein